MKRVVPGIIIALVLSILSTTASIYLYTWTKDTCPVPGMCFDTICRGKGWPLTVIDLGCGLSAGASFIIPTFLIDLAFYFVIWLIIIFLLNKVFSRKISS